jgi:hypothetical protein
MMNAGAYSSINAGSSSGGSGARSSASPGCTVSVLQSFPEDHATDVPLTMNVQALLGCLEPDGVLPARLSLTLSTGGTAVFGASFAQGPELDFNLGTELSLGATYTVQVLANAKVHLTPKSLEASAKATLSKVELGEADAAIVYVSDVASSGKVDGVAIPDGVNVLTTLPIVALKDSKNAALARAWVDFVVTHQAELVSSFGFLPL